MLRLETPGAKADRAASAALVICSGGSSNCASAQIAWAAAPSLQLRQSGRRRVVRMRIEQPFEMYRLKIADPARDERMLAWHDREKEAGIGRVTAVIDAREEAPDLVGVEQRALVNGLAPSLGCRKRPANAERDDDVPVDSLFVRDVDVERLSPYCRLDEKNVNSHQP